MRLDALFRVLFVVYCVEAGMLLLFAPWSSTLWDRQAVQLAVPALRQLALHPLTRGAVSGFGAIHLLWGLHDLAQWLFRRQPADP